MQKNKIIILALAILLAAPIFAENEVNIEQPEVQVEQLEAAQENNVANTLDEEVQSASDKLISPYKQPTSKKQTAKKFLMAMFGVVASSVLIYVLLTLYNKIRNIFNIPTSENTNIETSLETPKDIESAIKVFLEKTKW